MSGHEEGDCFRPPTTGMQKDHIAIG